ncbi:uncharacterized protein BDR25DRAFT_154234, partial [Lindgomyces ingoldianus]
PLSRRTTTLQSPNPLDNPIVNPKYPSTTTDRYILRHTIRSNPALISTLHTLLAPEGYSGPAFIALVVDSTDDEFDHRIKEFTQTIAHPIGTCALSTMLDGEFRVKG